MRPSSTIELDYNGLCKTFFDDNAPVTHGVLERATHAIQDPRQQITSHTIGFFSLPTVDNQCDEILTYAASTNFPYVLVLGIGGSSLGPLMLFRTLCHPHHNILHTPKIFFLDNVDPETIKGTTDVCDLKETLFIVISKSGSTLETLSQFAYFNHAFGPTGIPQSRCVVITDPDSGPLRQFATQRGYKTFSIPPNVGGRYSLLTPVGLLPAALMGIDIVQLLAGAQQISERLLLDQPDHNPALLLAMTLYRHYQHGIRTVVLFPYSDALQSFSDWLIQLIAESLGKKHSKSGESVGFTPISAVGAKDQHAQLQLFSDGPNDKLFIFFEVKTPSVTLPVPHAVDTLKILPDDQDFHAILSAEKRGTERSLIQNGRSTLTIRLDSVTPMVIGKLALLFETAVALLGHMMGIDPFDQPGVEWSKKIAKALLGDKKWAHLSENIPPVSDDRRIEA